MEKHRVNEENTVGLQEDTVGSKEPIRLSKVCMNKYRLIAEDTLNLKENIMIAKVGDKFKCVGDDFVIEYSNAVLDVDNEDILKTVLLDELGTIQEVSIIRISTGEILFNGSGSTDESLNKVLGSLKEENRFIGTWNGRSVTFGGNKDIDALGCEGLKTEESKLPERIDAMYLGRQVGDTDVLTEVKIGYGAEQIMYEEGIRWNKIVMPLVIESQGSKAGVDTKYELSNLKVYYSVYRGIFRICYAGIGYKLTETPTERKEDGSERATIYSTSTGLSKTLERYKAEIVKRGNKRKLKRFNPVYSSTLSSQIFTNLRAKLAKKLYLKCKENGEILSLEPWLGLELADMGKFNMSAESLLNW